MENARIQASQTHGHVPSRLYTPAVVVVRLRAPLRDLVDGQPEVHVDGATVVEALRMLERVHEPIAGWILDEQGRIRRHVNVFYDGDRVSEDARIPGDAVLHVLSAISGGDR
ncbi:MAG: MoaD/ThiS family protein [Gaiellales bacterium]